MRDCGSAIPANEASPNENQVGLTGAAQACPQQKRHQLTNADSADAARSFKEGVDHAAVAIRRQQLQRLQSESTSHNDSDDKKDAVWVSQSERKSRQRECGEMFIMRARDDRAGFNRG